MSEEKVDNSYRANKHNPAMEKFSVADALIVIILIILCATCVLPFLHLAAKSISDDDFVIAKLVYFIPKGLTFEAYGSLFKDGSLTYSFGYSVVLTLVFTILGMLVCTCAAYPLSKHRLKGRTGFTFLLMFPMYFSAGLIPSYLLYSRMGLLNTWWVLILPLIYSPYNMLIMKTYFQSTIPPSLEESAFLDGANNFQILWKIILPLCKPILATLSLFYAVGRWNAYSDNMYFIRKDSLKMVQYKLYQMIASATEAQSTSLSEAADVKSTPEVLQAASVMFVTLPIICVYPFLQKYFVKGVMVGAVKG